MRLGYLRMLVATACATVFAPHWTILAVAKAPAVKFRDSGDLTKLNGVWRSRGYGWLLVIEEGRVHYYDESASFCVEDADGTEDLDDLSARFEISTNGRTIRLPLGDAAYKYTFDKIDALPENCRREPDPSPISVLHAINEIFTAHYAFFGLRNIDWPALVGVWRKKVAGATSDLQLFDILKELLSRSNDAHVSLGAEIDGETRWHSAGDGKTLAALAAQARRRGLDVDTMSKRWEIRYWRKDIAETLLRGHGRRTANDYIQYGLIGGDIGYLGIRSMEGFDDSDNEGFAAVDRAMDRAMGLFAGAKAVIVDISINHGGYDSVARHIAGRFAAKRTLGYYKSAGDDDTDRPQAIYVEPSERRRYTGPVYLITSDATLSAAEIFTLCLRALPNVTHVGEATRGSLSDNLWKPLPNGWSLSLSNEIYLDADGKLWEGAGIAPEIEISIFSRKDVTVGHVKAVRAVVELARSR